jgi:tRNA A-37 threonylcarbamoyl transferase component Bud32
MSANRPIAIDSICWTRSEEGEKFLREEDLQLDRHLQEGRARVVKDGKHRSVYRVELPQGVVYWKHCRLNGPRAWWRDLLRGPKAKMEFDRASRLLRVGLETFEPLAWGKYSGAWPRGSFLITRELSDAIPLDQLLGTMTVPEEHHFTYELAKYIATLHSHGFIHPDLHPGNILVRRKAGYRFFLIDIHDLEFQRELKPEANLVLFNRWCQMRTSRSQRLRFFQAYKKHFLSRSTSPTAQISSEGVSQILDPRRIERATDRSNLKLWQSRGGRCLRGNRSFWVSKTSTSRIYASTDKDKSSLEPLLTNPDALLDAAHAVLLKKGRSSTVGLVTLPGEQGPLIYKRFQRRHWYDRWVNWFRPSPAMRSWINGHAFLDRGMPTPMPYLLNQQRDGTAYLLMERLEGAIDLAEWVAKATVTERRKMIDTLARWLRLLHHRHLTHRDLKAPNILVANEMVYFIDLVGCSSVRKMSERIRVRDLTRLNVSFLQSPQITRSDRLRFLRIYLLWNLRGQGNWRKMWKQIEEASWEKVRRNQRNDRPLA